MHPIPCDLDAPDALLNTDVQQCILRTVGMIPRKTDMASCELPLFGSKLYEAIAYVANGLIKTCVQKDWKSSERRKDLLRIQSSVVSPKDREGYGYLNSFLSSIPWNILEVAGLVWFLAMLFGLFYMVCCARMRCCCPDRKRETPVWKVSPVKLVCEMIFHVLWMCSTLFATVWVGLSTFTLLFVAKVPNCGNPAETRTTVPWMAAELPGPNRRLEESAADAVARFFAELNTSSSTPKSVDWLLQLLREAPEPALDQVASLTEPRASAAAKRSAHVVIENVFSKGGSFQWITLALFCFLLCISIYSVVLALLTTISMCCKKNFSNGMAGHLGRAHAALYVMTGIVAPIVLVLGSWGVACFALMESPNGIMHLNEFLLTPSQIHHGSSVSMACIVWSLSSIAGLVTTYTQFHYWHNRTLTFGPYDGREATYKSHRKSLPELVETTVLKGCLEGDAKVIQKQFDEGVDVAEVADDRGNRGLHYAAYNNNLDAARTMLELGADPDSTNQFAYTPFQIAVNEGYKEMAELLAKYGADVDKEDAFGDSPLHAAALRNKTKIVPTLLSLGADPLLRKGSLNQTPAEVAAGQGGTMLAEYLEKQCDGELTRDRQKRRDKREEEAARLRMAVQEHLAEVRTQGNNAWKSAESLERSSDHTSDDPSDVESKASQSSEESCTSGSPKDSRSVSSKSSKSHTKKG